MERGFLPVLAVVQDLHRRVWGYPAVLVASHQGRRLVVVVAAAVVVVLMLFCRDHALPVLMEVCSCHHHCHR
jgi:hypothetical protein